MQPPPIVVTVRIEDREAAIARHGAKTMDALQRYFENWPSALPREDAAGERIPPSFQTGEAHPRATTNAPHGQPVPPQPVLLKAGRIRVMLGVALLASLALWILIIQIVRILF